jgi:hypothetical protein
MIFHIISVNPMDLCYLSKMPIFILYLNTNIAKIHDMFMGGEKIRQTAIFLLADSVFCCFEHMFESQDDSF